MHNDAINSDPKKLRCAPLFGSGYGWRYAQQEGSMQYDSILIVKDIVIAVAAFVGMGLGFLNFWNEKQKDKVKLRVMPKAVFGKGRNADGREFVLTTLNEFNEKKSQGIFCVEVLNLSKFPVVIDEVGFFAKKARNRMAIVNPILSDGGSWPRKLEPRESVSVYGSLQDMMSSSLSPNVYCAFAETSCGHTAEGTSPALGQFVDAVKKSA